MSILGYVSCVSGAARSVSHFQGELTIDTCFVRDDFLKYWCEESTGTAPTREMDEHNESVSGDHSCDVSFLVVTVLVAPCMAARNA